MCAVEAVLEGSLEELTNVQRVLGEVSVVCLLAVVVKGSLGVVRLAVADVSPFDVVASAFFPA